MGGCWIAILGCWAGAVVFGGAPAPLGADWTAKGGSWALVNRFPGVVWQSAGRGLATAIPPRPPGPGNVWRCAVEPGPDTESAGFYFGASPDYQQGYIAVLGGAAEQGIGLCDASGNVLWRDTFPIMAYYTPVVLEGIVEPGRVRLQALKWDREIVLAQSDWIPVQDVPPESRAAFALFTNNGPARFWQWERSTEALSDLLADSPSKLRLSSDGAEEWSILGHGDWRWTTAEREVLKQCATVERSMAIKKAACVPEGVWRCRVSVSPGAGGAGMLLLTDEKAQGGFLVWLGGEFGNGALMIYRLPEEALWTSEQGKWGYDTEYLLEGTVHEGNLQARLLGGDGQIAAESPLIELSEEEKRRPGFSGYETWKGAARFWDFAEAPAQAPIEELPVVQGSPLGPDWRVIEGSWHWADGEKTVVWQVANQGIATAIHAAHRASRGAFRAMVFAGQGARRVSLLFQASADGKEGFECRLEGGISLRTLDGRVLWAQPGFVWEAGKAYQLEGQVMADRVRVLVRNESGGLLAQSEDCYVTDQNNGREGCLGFRSEGGSVQYTGWSVTAAD